MNHGIEFGHEQLRLMSLHVSHIYLMGASFVGRFYSCFRYFFLHLRRLLITIPDVYDLPTI